MGAAGNSTGTAQKKVPGRPYQRGQSGNPSGRPKVDPELRTMMRALTPAIAKRIAEEINKDGPDWLDASKVALAYGWGRPPAAPEDHQAMSQSGAGLTVLATEDIVAAVKKLNAGQDDGE